MEKQITIISILNIAFGFLRFISAIIIFLILTGIGFISGNENALLIMATIGSIIGFFLIITSIPEIIGGIGLMKYRKKARSLTLFITRGDRNFRL
jgi:hypothetical protein